MKRDRDTFPWREMEKYSDNQSAKHAVPAWFFRAIEGWSSSISPHTPPHGFFCSPSDDVLVYVRCMLAAFEMILRTSSPRVLKIASSRLVPIWPSIWTWIRTMHAQNQQWKSPLMSERESTNALINHRLLVKLLLLLVFSNSPTPIRILVHETKGVQEIMASMWLEEAKDASGSHGFKAALLIQTVTFAPSLNVLPYIVADRCPMQWQRGSCNENDLLPHQE